MIPYSDRICRCFEICPLNGYIKKVFTENKMYHNFPCRFVSAVTASMLVLGVLLSSYQISASAETSIVESSMPLTCADEQASIEGFFDVGESSWFYDEVMSLAKRNIVNGYPDGGFHPESSITAAEFIKMMVAAFGEGLEMPSVDSEADNYWASGYIELARSAGILSDGDFEFDSPLLRTDMVKIISSALKIKPDDSIHPFADSSDPLAASLYREYILRGVPDDNGNRFNFDNDETRRSEAAVIVSRVVDYSTDTYNYKKNFILNNASQYELKHEFELADLFRVLNREFISDYIIKTPYTYSEWIEIYRRANVQHLEDFYASYLNCEYVKNSHTYKLSLDFELEKDELVKYRTDAELAADYAVRAVVLENMTDAEKIKAIHDYLILNCSYDYENYHAGTISYGSRLAYGALCLKNAVCQGYTAAFSMMARRAGVYAEAVAGKAPGNDDTHVWNRVFADGEVYYIDVTHDDPVPDQHGMVSYKYFMLTEDEMLALGYLWDRDVTSGDKQIKIHG